MSTVPAAGGAGPGLESGAAPDVGPGLAVERVDALLAERARSSGEFLAGLIAAGELATVGSPRLLPEDLFPGGDPVLVRAVWDRALAVGLHAGRVSVAPRFRRDELARLQQELEAVGFRAMGGLVARSVRLVAPAPTAVEAVQGPDGV